MIATGCGSAPDPTPSPRFQGEQRSAAEAIHRLSTALRTKDTHTVCRVLISSQLLKASEQARRRDQTSCDHRFGDNDEYATVGPIYTVKTIRSIRVHGTTATAHVVSEARKGPIGLPLAKLHGHWIIVFPGD